MMVERRYLAAEELPPRPDPSAGLPRPPRAPGFIGRDISAKDSVIREQDEALAPGPPPGQSPVMVWYQESSRGSVISTVVVVLVAAGLFTMSRGTTWILDPKYWGLWVFFAASLI